jgi:hypothetical protein
MRRAALLLALGLAFSAAPARAQESARFAPAATPLPASLQPPAAADRDPGPAEPVDVLRATAIGAVVGCAILGFMMAGEEDASVGTSTSSRAALGCGFGAFAGSVFAFTFATMKNVLEGR